MLGAPVTVTPPASDLISLAAAKSYLRVDGNAFDVELDLMRKAAVADVEQLTGTRLITQVVSVSADSFGELAQLRVGPVQDVVSISYRDADGADQTVDPLVYELLGAALDPGIIRKPGAAWPSAAVGSIKVELTVGYGDDPDDLPSDVHWAAYAALRGKFEQVEVDLSALLVNHRIWLG